MNINIINRPPPVVMPKGIAASAPNIASAAMLVDMSISVWTARKKDQRASEDVTQAAGAARGAARVTKDLLGSCEELAAIQRFSEGVRTTHRAMTMPWSDLGLRLLPTAQFFKYHPTMTAAKDEFGRLVEAFLSAYSWEISKAQLQLGTLYDPNEYPSVEAVRDKFAFRLNLVPLPSAGDWRVDIASETKAALETEYSKYFQAQLKGAMDDLWGRLRDTISTLASQLEPLTENGKTRRIHDSVVDRAHELIAMMETCNVTGDPAMAGVQRRLSEVLRGASADAFRTDEAYRADTKAKLEAALQALPGVGW